MVTVNEPLGWFQSFSSQAKRSLCPPLLHIHTYSTPVNPRLCCVASPWPDVHSGETSFVAFHVASEANVTRHNRWLLNIQWHGLEIYIKTILSIERELEPTRNQKRKKKELSICFIFLTKNCHLFPVHTWALNLIATLHVWLHCVTYHLIKRTFCGLQHSGIVSWLLLFI